MLITLLILYLIALSLGIGLLILGLLTYEKLQVKAFRDAAWIAVACTLLLLTDSVNTSMVVLRLGPDPALRLFCIILAVAGCGTMAYALPSIAFRVVNEEVSRLRWAVHIALIAALMALAFWREASESRVAGYLVLAGIGCLHAYAGIVVIKHFGRITDPPEKYLLRGLLVLMGIFQLAIIAEILASLFKLLPEAWRGIPFFQIFYSISVSAVVLFFAFKYMFKPTLALEQEIPVDFITRYGVSGRECEIISLVIQGHSHKEIGDKLFISSRTVKNHIYNIYQKTGVANKVQLMNRIRSSRMA